MTRITKLALEQQLVAQGRELEALRLANSVLRADLESARAKLAAIETVAPAAPAINSVAPKRGYMRPAPDAATLARRASMAAARELAIRTGRSVVWGGQN